MRNQTGSGQASAAARLRWMLYGVLIAAAAGQMAGRILAVNSVDRVQLERYLYRQYQQGRRRADQWQVQRPFLSANDRSRWATVRALVEYGTYEIDQVIRQRNWDTIDKVRHRNAQGQMRFYSSKPPLLATLVAGPYWVIYRVTGKTLGEHPWAIGRALLLLVNWLPMLGYLVLVAALAERLGRGTWPRLVVVAAACFATFLSTFVVALNNHLPAAVSVAAALAALYRIWHGRAGGVAFFLGGLAAAFAAACDLPALAFFALATLAALGCDWRRTLLGWLPGAAVVAAAFFGTNYLAHQSLRPPYAHRHGQDNWYDYPGSYWQEENRQGIDRGEPSRAVYAFHVLLGHHGVFSLTPLWLLSLVGIVRGLVRKEPSFLRAVALGTAVLTVVVLSFYIARPLIDRNYGGMTSGFRWSFWLTPLWLLCLLPALEVLQKRRWGRAVVWVAVALSALSASYPTWNPWVHPWLYDALVWLGLLPGG